jgi:hypothetical protein
VVRVHHGTAFSQEPRQYDVRLCVVVVDELRDARLTEELESAIGDSRPL